MLGLRERVPPDQRLPPVIERRGRKETTCCEETAKRKDHAQSQNWVRDTLARICPYGPTLGAPFKEKALSFS
jgi:hypothetical protein